MIYSLAIEVLFNRGVVRRSTSILKYLRNLTAGNNELIITTLMFTSWTRVNLSFKAASITKNKVLYCLSFKSLREILTAIFIILLTKWYVFPLNSSQQNLFEYFLSHESYLLSLEIFFWLHQTYQGDCVFLTSVGASSMELGHSIYSFP